MFSEQPRHHLEGNGKSKSSKQRNYEVRCVIELDDNETFKNNKVSVFPAGVPDCPAMRQRFTRHVRGCHNRRPKLISFGTNCNSNRQCQTVQVGLGDSKSFTDREVLTDLSRNSVALSPVISVADRLTAFHRHPHACRSNSTYGRPVKAKYNPKNNANDFQKRRGRNTCDGRETKDKSRLKQSETFILHSKGHYRDILEAIIQQWLKEIPVFPNVDQSTKILRENDVNELIETIFNLSVDINNELYECNIKGHILNFLDALPIWYPYTLKDRKCFKDDLENNLFNKIKKLNKQLFNTSDDKKKDVRDYSNRKQDTASKIEQLVINYLSNLKFVQTDDWGHPLDMQEVRNVVLQQLKSILKVMSEIGDNKLFLKMELINILRGIPLDDPCNEEENIDMYAHELADNILAIRKNKCCRHSMHPYLQNYKANVFYYNHSESNVSEYELTQDIIELINTVIDTDNSLHKEELIDLLLDSFHSIRSGNESRVKNKIYEFLISCYDISDKNASFLTNKTVEKMKRATRCVIDKSCSPFFSNSDSLSKSVLVYVSDHNISGPASSNYPITSTPKKSISKLNAEERKYTDDLSKLIHSWIDSIPELQHIKEDSNYKEVVVSDLAGNLMDEIKLEQCAPDKKYNDTRNDILQCAIRRWIMKFGENAFKNINDVKPHIDHFIQKFSEIPVPVLSRPQHGSRRDIKAALFRHDFSDEQINMIPEGIDILEDGISIWMNEQPTSIFLNENRDERNEMLHDFATKIQSQLKNKASIEEIKLETRLWLDKMLKPNEKNNIDSLSEALKDRIIKMPINETFNENFGENETSLNEYLKPQQDSKNNKMIDINLKKTLLQFIDKFIEHNCEEDDTVVKDTYSELLKSEFRRLVPHENMELNNNNETKYKSKDKLSEKLNRELHYIKDISDWLKNIPIDNSFNIPGNEKRVEFVIDLARDICEIEMERLQSPQAMDYDNYLSHLIYRNYALKLPILPNCIQYYPQVVQQLIDKIIKSRKELNLSNANKYKVENDSLKMEEQKLGEFIDEYIRVNGKEIAHDPAKLETWTARLLNEINRMILESDPSSAIKMQAYDRLGRIPFPGDKSTIEFDRKLMYAHEIGDWIKNMPLQRISNQETTDMIVKMISELAEKLSEKHSDNIKDDPELQSFVMNWILALPLEPSKEIDTFILIQQLSNRIKRVNAGKNQSLHDSDDIQYSINTSKINQNYSRESFSITRKRDAASGKSKVGSSGELVVQAIENWCKKLPIKGKEGGNDDKTIKDNIAIKLLQKVGDLNLEPRFHDDILYRNQLSDDIDDIFEYLQQYNEVQKNKESLKSSLIDNIENARAIIKEQTAGDQYKHKLENTIEAAIPNPIINSRIYDPGFELYKTKLANMFILENFDHGDDPVKLKYEVKIKDEIDKYFLEAQKRNAVPLSKDEIYNELYSALFKVPIPNETSVIQEVEEVKLRCEIDGWFETLPIREAENLNELLDWDKILAMLAKRLYEIESNEPKAEDLIHKEITKWLVKFPLLPGEEINIDIHAKTLEDRLKSSKDYRKCTPKTKADKLSKKGKSLRKLAGLFKKSTEDNSQVAGPSGSVPKSESAVSLVATPKLKASSVWESSETSELSPNPYCVAASTPSRKPADIILEIVENWCQTLPLYTDPGQTADMSTVKDDLMTKILRKLSELNANPEIFDDDFLYDDYLDEELDQLMKTLPKCCEMHLSTEARKYQLISAIRSIKPLIRAERARHEYKKEIKNTIKNMLQGPLDTTPEIAFFDDLVDVVADSFVQYNYNKDDYEGKQIYKNQIRDAIIKYYSDMNREIDEDTLIKQNKLLCELAKIPIPSEAAIKEDVEEIKMKHEVSNFLDEVIPDESNTLTQKKVVKTNLSKRLHELEKSGHSCDTDKTMKEEIARSLKKVNTEVGIDKIEKFVNKLKETEAIRKSPPNRKSEIPTLNVSQQLKQHCWLSGHVSENSATPNYDCQPSTLSPTLSSPSGQSYQYQPSESIKYYTLLPEGLGNNQPQVIQVRPQTIKWYQPGTSQCVDTTVRSQEWHSLPLQSPNKQPPDMVSIPHSLFQTLPTPTPEYRPVSEIANASNSRGQSVKSTSMRSPERSIPIEASAMPVSSTDNRFIARPQIRRHSLSTAPTNTNTSVDQRRASLQAPLKYDNNFYDNRNITKSYRELCLNGNVSIPHAPLNVIVFDDANFSTDQSQAMPQTSLDQSVSLMQESPRAVPTAPPLQTVLSTSKSQKPCCSNQHQTTVGEPYLSASRPINTQSTQNYQEFQAATPIPHSAQSQQIPEPNLMASRPISSAQSTQIYQGFQNAVPALSSPVQAQPKLISGPIPISAVPQSTKYTSSLGQSTGPTISNIPQETPEDVSPAQGVHRMAAAPETLRNSPRKRRRTRCADEEKEETCDCLERSGRKRRCIPLPEEWGCCPIWCYMPYSSVEVLGDIKYSWLPC